MIRLSKLLPIVASLWVLVGGLNQRLVQAVTLVHSNDALGDIKPCGCRKNPQGGVARKANLLKRIKDPDLIQLDAGDLLFSTLNIPPLLAEQAEVQAGFLLRSMELIHHDLVVPGEKEFALGFKVFEKLRKKSKIQWIAANLTRKGGVPFLEPYVILTRSKKVAVLGLVGPDLPWPKELKASSAIAAAKKWVPQLRKKADYVVVLSHQGIDEDVQLAKKVSGIDVIIGAHSQSFLQEPTVIGSTWILQSSFRNQYIGVLELSHPLKNDLYQLTGLDAGYDSPPELPSAVDELVLEFEKAVAQINSKKEAEDVLRTQANLGNKKIPKYQTFTQCAECHLKQFDFWRGTSHFRALDTLVQKKQEKNKECMSCHTLGLGDPQGLKDVIELATYQKSTPEGRLHDYPLSSEQLNRLLNQLRSLSSVKDPVEWQEPVSGKPEPRPVRQVLHSLVKSWAPVQCENCHLPGGNHPFTGTYSKEVKSETCLKCHTRERASDWYGSDGAPLWTLIQEKRKQVACPAGEIDE